MTAVKNILTIQADAARVAEILDTVKYDKINFPGLGSVDFNKIIPIPEHIYQKQLSSQNIRRYMNNNWFDFCVHHWGCLWNSFGYDYSRHMKSGTTPFAF